MSEGVSSHASRPQLGKNAVMQLIAFLSTVQFDPVEVGYMIRFLQKRIAMDTTGLSFGLGFADASSGHLTLNAGVVTLRRQGLYSIS